jgi:phenylacetate-CoA ligase
MKSQHWSIEQLEDYQINKLRYLSNVFNLKIHSWEDFYSMPITTKEDIPLDFKPKVKKYIAVESSGSTGEPRSIFIPSAHWLRKEAVFMRNWKWLGWNFEPVLRLGPAKPAWSWYDRWRNTKVLDRKNITETHIQWTIKHKPFIIHGRGGGVQATCEGVIKAGRADALRNTRILWLGEDPTRGKERLSPFVKGFYTGYGLAELAAVAGPCSYGNMHINMDCGIIEVVKGDIIVTDIDNDVMPFIRYKTGDEGRIKDSDCPCGSKFPILYDVEGRRTDYYDGPEVKKPIHWWVVGPLSHPPYGRWIKAWKCEIYPAKKRFVLYIVFRDKENLEVFEEYKKWIKDETGLDCEILVKDTALKWKRQLVTVKV